MKARLRDLILGMGEGSTPRTLASIATLALLIATTAILIYWRRDDFEHFNWHLRVEYLVLSAVAFVVALLLVVWLWARLMSALGQHLPFTTHLRYFGLSNIAKRLPGTIWYVAGRAYLYKQKGISPSLIAVASGVEVITLTLASALVALTFAGSQLISYINSDVRTIPFLTISLIISLISVHPRTIKLIINALSGQQPPTFPTYGFLLTQTLLSAGVWISGGVMFYAFCASVAQFSWTHLPYIIGVWALSSLLSSFMFFLPTNFGVKEVSSSLLLSIVMPLPAAVISVIMSRLMVIAYETIWALASIWSERQLSATTTKEIN